MFGKTKSSNALVLRKDAAVPSVISSDLSIIGNLVSEGVVEVAGRIEGNIKCDILNLHPTGLIKGDIIAKEAKINGEINGVIKSKKVSVLEKGKIHGFVIYESIVIAEGAILFGQLKQTDREDIAEEHINASPMQQSSGSSGAAAASAAPAAQLKEASSGSSGKGKIRLVNKD